MSEKFEVTTNTSSGFSSIRKKVTEKLKNGYNVYVRFLNFESREDNLNQILNSVGFNINQGTSMLNQNITFYLEKINNIVELWLTKHNKTTSSLGATEYTTEKIRIGVYEQHALQPLYLKIQEAFAKEVTGYGKEKEVNESETVGYGGDNNESVYDKSVEHMLGLENEPSEQKDNSVNNLANDATTENINKWLGDLLF